MMVGEAVGFAAIDWIGQTPIPTSLTPVPPTSLTPIPPTPVPTMLAPVAPTQPTGTQVIPVVQIGPARIMDRSGYAVPGVRATIRTPGRILGMPEVPGGIFQTVVDRADFDAGITILFGAPDRPALSVPANALYCNTGTRNEYGTITSMTQNPCNVPPYYFETAQQVEPPGQPAYQTPQAPAQAPAAPVRSRRRKKRPAGTTETTEAAAPASAPAGRSVLLAAGGETSPWLYVAIGGGALALIGIIVFAMK